MSFPSLSTLAAGLDSRVSVLLGASWRDSLSNLAKKQILTVLSKISTGSLIVIADGESHIFGGHGPRPELETTLTIHSPEFWVRVMTGGDLGFAEAYMFGEVTCPDLTSFFKIFILNRTALSAPTSVFAPLTSLFSLLPIPSSHLTLSAARANIAAHYDLPPSLFAAFLSSDMTYSCGLFASPTEPLEDAQLRKLDLVISQLRLSATDTVLEIGCGWGSFAVRAAKTTGCRVVGLTLSEEQKVVAERRIAEAGLADKVEVRLENYLEHVGRTESLYDKIVAIEMLEHAGGPPGIQRFWEKVDGLCKKDGGIVVVQFSAMPETRYNTYCGQTDFIKKWVRIPSHRVI